MSDIAKPNFHAGKTIILAQGKRIAELEAALEAALSTAPAGDGVAGMVLVPREPTPEILNAWSYTWGEPNAANCWRDMLNAALSASTAGGGK